MLSSLKPQFYTALPWMEPWSHRRLAVADRLGLFALLLVALTGLWAGDLYRFGLLLLLVAFLLAAVDLWPQMKRSIPFWLGLGFVIFATIRHWISVVELGADVVDSPPKSSQFMRSSPLFLLMAAVWIRGERQRLVLVMAAAGLGAVAWIVTGTHWDAVLQMLRDWDWSSTRWELHAGSTNRVPLILLLISLGLATVGVGWAARVRPIWLRAGLVGTTLTLAAALLALSLTIETRSTQLAAVLGYGIVLAAAASVGLRALGLNNRVRWAITGAGSIAFIAVAVTALVTIAPTSDRLQQTVEAGQVLAENPEYLRDPFAAADEHQAISRGRVVQRLNLLNLGADAVAERPLVGWGGGTNHLWVSDNGRTDFHNWYLETAVAFGLIGVLLYFGGFAYLIGSATRGWRQKRLDSCVALFVLSAAAAWMVTQLFTTWISSSQGRFIVVFLGALLAIAHTARWWPRPIDEVRP